MGAPRRCWLRPLLAACLAARLAALPAACPRLCACYGPAEVHCTFRYFTAVPPRIAPDVERINLGYNSLLTLTDTDFAGLEKLELLMLHSNEINAIPEKVFRDLRSLQVLKMSYNKVSVLQQDAFYGLKSLVRLHMDHNEIKFVNPNVFYGLTSLRLVHLEGNLLKQLHPDTFVTLSYLQIFKVSSIKHVHLSDNTLTSLPREMFSYMSELESIYLHGNPWACDCDLQWFAEWAEQRPDVIKCKKDRSSGAQQCPVCASPRNCKGKNFVGIPPAALTCTKPVIHHTLKLKNLTVPEDGDFSSVSPKDFLAPIGSVVLNMTDQGGNRGNLVCNVQKPKEMSPISFDKEDNVTVLRTSFSSFLVCDIAYGHIQQLWSILALYSNSPLKLDRSAVAAETPFITYQYKQNYSEKDELFTKVEAELRAEPSWLMQNKVALQLDRTATTLSTLHIQYFTDAEIVLPTVDQKKVGKNWTVISRDNKTQTEHTVPVGRTAQLDCQAIGQPAPAIEWILADGSKVRAPYVSEDGRIVVAKSGTFTLRTADTFDSGLYHCIGTNGHDADVLTFRITVVDPYVEHSSVNGAQFSTAVGSILDLPCTSAAVPDAAISWVLPERVVLHHSVRNKQIFGNGTLRIQGVTERDNGYFRCVAANQYGVDLLIFQVLVREGKSTPQKAPVAAGEWEESDGSGDAALPSGRGRQNSSAALLSWMGREPSAPAHRQQGTHSTRTGSGPRRMTSRQHRDKAGRRLRGHRRRFGSSAKRANPQRWAAFLEKAKRNPPGTEKQEVETTPPVQVHEFSTVPADEEETSGAAISPEQEFMIVVTEGATMSSLGSTAGSTAPAGAGTPPPAPFPQPSPSVSPTPADLNPMTTTSDSWERPNLSQTSASGGKQSMATEGASRTSVLISAQQRSAPPGEHNSLYLKAVSATTTGNITNSSTPATSQNAVGEMHGFTEFTDKISTKTDGQASAATISKPNSEFGHIHFHSAQKPVTPALPLGPNIVTHQHAQIIQDVTTHTPQARQQHGRRRKVSARRKMVRPGRLLSMKEHRRNSGKQGSAGGRTAIAPAVLLSSTHSPNVPTFNNSHSSINPLSPEAPLSSPSTTDMSSEHSEGTARSTAFLMEEDSAPTARQGATSTALPVVTQSTGDAAQKEAESRAPCHSSTYKAQPVSSRLPTSATRTAHTAEITHMMSTRTASAPPTVFSRSSSKNSQGGKIIRALLFGNGTQKEVPRTGALPPTELSVLLPEITAVASRPHVSPLPFTPISVDIDPVPSLGKPADSSSTSEKPPDCSPAMSTAGGTGRESAKPTTTASVAPQKAFRTGRRRGQRRRRPPKTAPSQSPTTGARTTADAASATTAAASPPAAPTRHAPAAAGSDSPPAGWVPALWALPPPGTAQHGPTTAPQTAAAPSMVVSNPPASLLPHSPRPQTPTATASTPPLPSEPLGAKRVHPAAVSAAARSESAQHLKASTPAAERPHLWTDKEAARGSPVARPLDLGSTELSSRALGTMALREQRPTSAPSMGGIGAGLPPTERGGKTSTVNTPTVSTPWQVAAPHAYLWGSSADGWSDQRQHHKSTTSIPLSLFSLSGNYFTKPRIIGGKLAAFTVLANSDAFIPCEATGNPQPTVEWTKISPETDAPASGSRWSVLPNGTLAIVRAALQDGGQYCCTATNALGTARLLATLAVVAYPPRIAGGTRLLTAHAGTPVAMRCPAEGRPPPSISWVLANETHVSSSSQGNQKVLVQPDGTLMIKDVTVYDRGLYTCTATNPAGADTLTVKLQVIAAPPVIVEEKRQQITAMAGRDLSLPCTAEGNPQPRVHWVLPEGTVVKPLQFVDTGVLLLPNGTLRLSSIAPTDSGNYECIATSSTGSERRVVTLTVRHRDTLPRIAAASQGMTQLSFGDKLLLNCTATGEPRPRIIWRLPSKAVVDQWHRMGSRIHVYPNGSLVIEAVTEKDAGDYLCVARNKIGDDLILMKVSITMKPAKIDQKQYFKKLVPYGKDFQVDCKASGSPAPEISWSLPDGTVINNAMLADDSGHRSGRYVLFDNGTLYLNRAGATEEGDYTCYAQNTLGRDEMKIHITVVTAAPRIKHSHKTYIKVKAGDTALLDCEAAGEPKPKIFWLLPSSDMISSSTDRHLLHTNGSLSVRRAKLLDAGEYMCVARNAGGDDTKLYKLDVVAKPPIINGLYTNKTIIKVTAVRHSKKQIDCRAEGTPPPQIMWIMPDNIFLTAPYYGSRIVVHKNGTLEIRNLRPSDTADFICVARNDWGESMLVVRLEVLEMLRRPMFKNPFNEKIIAKPGKTITLNCSVDGNPPPEVSWMLPNGTWFSKGTRMSEFLPGSHGTLTIRNPSRDKAGKYRCAAKNQVGYIEKLIVLEVAQKPTILVYPQGPMRGISGESLSLHCLSDGSPKPSTAWTLPGGHVLDRPQINSRHILLENGTLVIRAATIHDRGNYVCKAHNPAGDLSVTVPVTIVAYPPRITNRPPQTISTMPGAAVQLSCMALGIPKPEITWELPDRSVLSPGNRGRAPGSELLHPQGTLIIQNPRPSDSGTYKCTAKNHLGSDFTVTYIHVI
ncbi:immunoglobulin superfamily member 10 isoform X2 [Tympanuchus pallidicinctus]|uniref:immunoglobulin superfamily member 10 isoform X2 n=1 Tax=Tympanuchus pallidicinctus TaxID=109042 RepID=UPI0022870BBB|nr:immunoglobulin superfamily member 10 isoform X2 [Tympanuchus pallidicinctus]